jgi:hypothetical protein
LYRRQRLQQEKMADGNARNVREASDAPRRSRSSAQARGYFSFKEDYVEVGDFSPLNAAETEQSSAEAGTSEKNMEFVRRTMLSATVQEVVAKVDLAVQNLLVATKRSDPQNLQHRSRALRTALAWATGHLDYVDQRCGT